MALFSLKIVLTIYCTENRGNEQRKREKRQTVTEENKEN